MPLMAVTASPHQPATTSISGNQESREWISGGYSRSAYGHVWRDGGFFKFFKMKKGEKKKGKISKKLIRVENSFSKSPRRLLKLPAVVEKNLGGLSSAADAESVDDIEGDTEVSGSSHDSEEVGEKSWCKVRSGSGSGLSAPMVKDCNNG
ncbi:hypothetical protein DFH08DRAFT_801958 [Mycena albidolilacea]|uniref:Uncharacterized protein n=1 Tax=Mycena albidolilacea TaxID=1033008 RepID=A0AAD7AHR1_9AGAR|nr:hypothetical protein DFH08DRAFT_801958 [Mycena albidolilacea]